LELYEAIRTRRSVRRYRPDPVPDQLVQKIIEAASWAPSSSNSQPWEFVVVRERNTLEDSCIRRDA
jgi:nitroreductase